MSQILEKDVIRLFSVDGNNKSSEPMLARFPTSYVNALCFGYHQATGGSEESRQQLLEAARLVAFYRLGPTFASKEWKTHVRPQLNTSEDWVRAILELMPALGWGEWHLVQLVPDEQLIVQVKEGYEADGYLKNIGVSGRGGVCFFATSMGAGIMNLVYNSPIAEGGILSEEDFLNLFDASAGFSAEEIECQAAGKECCKIIVTKNR